VHNSSTSANTKLSTFLSPEIFSLPYYALNMSSTHQTLHLCREPLPSPIHPSVTTVLELDCLRKSLHTAQQAAAMLEAQLDASIIKGVQNSIDALESLHAAHADLGRAQRRGLAWRTERNDARALLKSAERELEEMRRRGAWRGEKRHPSADVDGESPMNERKAAKRVKLEETLAAAKRRLSSHADPFAEGDKKNSKRVKIDAMLAGVKRRLSSQASTGVVEAKKDPKRVKIDTVLAGAKRRLSSYSRSRVEANQKASKRIRVEFTVAGVKRRTVSAAESERQAAKEIKLETMFAGTKRRVSSSISAMTCSKKVKHDDQTVGTSFDAPEKCKNTKLLEMFDFDCLLAGLKREKSTFVEELEEAFHKIRI